MKATNDAKFDVTGFTYNPTTGHIFLDGERREFLNITNRYRFVERNYVRVLSARLAWRLYYGQWPGRMEVDHQNRNRQDNKIGNLRLATRSQNIANSPACTTCKSGERGVWWDKRFNTWRWDLRHEGKKYRGYASHKISAIVAARLIRRILHGEFGTAQEAA